MRIYFWLFFNSIIYQLNWERSWQVVYWKALTNPRSRRIL